MKKFNVLPGLLLTIFIAILATWFGQKIQTYVKIETLTIAIILGILLNNTVKIPQNMYSGIKFSLKKLLKVGIVLLGFKLNIQGVIALGPKLLLLVLIFVPLVIGVFMFLNKWFGVNKKLATLLGVGSCICGASAVVALAPVINADEDDAVVAVSIVSVLGAIGVIIYSGVSSLMSLSDIHYGVWSGLTLHGVAHAIAAAFAQGDIAGEIGTFVKMARVLMLVPVSIFLSLKFKTGEQKASFPLYVLLFILAGIINSLNLIPNEITKILGQLSSYMILLAMTAMGLSVNFKQIIGKGIRAFVMAALLFLTSSLLFLYIIVSFV